MDNNAKKRELMHSISRITDRFALVIRDISHQIDSKNKEKQHLLELQEDVLKLQQAMESFFTDIISNDTKGGPT